MSLSKIFFLHIPLKIKSKLFFSPFAGLGLHIERSGPKEIAANVSSNVNLSCLVDKTVTELEDLLLTWNFKNQSDPLKIGGKYRIPALEPITSCRRAFKLEIINVTANDEGVYTCHQTCKDSGGDVCKDSAQFELKVHSPRPKEYSPPLTKSKKILILFKLLHISNVY